MNTSMFKVPIMAWLFTMLCLLKRASIFMLFAPIVCANFAFASNYKEVRDEMLRLAKEYKIPPIIIQAIAVKESEWDHFRDGSVRINQESKPDNRQGIGIMQLTVCPPDVKCKSDKGIEYPSVSKEKYNNLRNDWKYNLEQGVIRLNDKWKEQLRFDKSVDTEVDKGIIENWYYPVM